MKKIPYYELPKLRDLYLEDSYVLEIQQYDKYIDFFLEAVLTEEHPLYKSPLPNEQYCYKNIKLRFSNFDKAKWIEKTNVSNIDINGEIDIGNIDCFYQSDNYFYLEGEWGKLKISGAATYIEPIINRSVTNVNKMGSI